MNVSKAKRVELVARLLTPVEMNEIAGGLTLFNEVQYCEHSRSPGTDYNQVCPSPNPK